MLFSTSGKGRMSAGGRDLRLRRGTSFLLGRGAEVELDSEGGLLLYRAYAE